MKKSSLETLRPLSREQRGVSRRQFLNRATSASFGAFMGFFGMGTLSFLWPKLTGGFGTKIMAGDYEDILSKVGPEGGFTPLFIPEGRFYLTYYDGTGDAPCIRDERGGYEAASPVSQVRPPGMLGAEVRFIETLPVSLPWIEISDAWRVLRGPGSQGTRPFPDHDREREGCG